MLNPVDLPAPPVPINRAPAQPTRGNPGRSTEVVRQVAMASVNNPNLVPKTTSATPNRNLPVPDSGRFRIGPEIQIRYYRRVMVDLTVMVTASSRAVLPTSMSAHRQSRLQCGQLFQKSSAKA